MSRTVEATWRNGQVVPDEPLDLPDGRRLVVTEVGNGVAGGPPVPSAEGPNAAGDDKATEKAAEESAERPTWWERFGPIEFMTEEEQGGTPEAIEAWIADYEATPPLELTQEEEERLDQYLRDIGQGGLGPRDRS